MTEGALIAEGDLDAAFAIRAGRAISRRRFLADAVALAERLPGNGAMLNLSSDRYRFAVGFAAALLRGHTSLLPPNHVADTVDAPARRALPASTRWSTTATTVTA